MVPSFRGSQSLSAARRGGGTDYAGSSSPDKRKKLRYTLKPQGCPCTSRHKGEPAKSKLFSCHGLLDPLLTIVIIPTYVRIYFF